ncbi:hypothetical protein L3X38_005003 [Prunus dulcis]|uniref:Uncharacterized protein n=1 Tax=Prunus dulcis TaxID=3755 RepID=A0AAD5F3P7_PRUDU|nr:hypothetical protein L3X38_005003 [Prunus dulcis]
MRLLERQERENEESRRKQAEEEREEVKDGDQVAIVVGMLHQSSNGHRGAQVRHGQNVDRHRHSPGDYGNRNGKKSIILQAVAKFDI